MEHKFKDLNQLLTELPEIGGPLDLLYIYIYIYIYICVYNNCTFT